MNIKIHHFVGTGGAMRQWSGLISMIGGDRVLVRDYWVRFGVVGGDWVISGVVPADWVLFGGSRR